MRSVLDAFLGRTVQSADAAAAVLAHPRCPPPAGQLATWALVAACGVQGRLDGLDEKCNGLTPALTRSRPGCTRRPLSDRRGSGGCSWLVCWIAPMMPRGNTASAARALPESRI